jgi:hypothetical protein
MINQVLPIIRYPKSKKNVRAYWEQALERVPDLQFELLEVLVNVNSLILYTKAFSGKLAAKIFFVGEYRKVNTNIAHYTEI